jgi:HlyD family secretion protein
VNPHGLRQPLSRQAGGKTKEYSMKRKIALTSSVLALLLAGCAQATPTAQTSLTPQAAPTAAPTSALSSFGMGAPTTEPAVQPTAVPVQIFTVQRGTIENILELSGTVDAVQSAMTFSQDGVIGQIFVKPGQAVAKGDLVAELELGDLSRQLREAQLVSQQDQSNLSRAAEAGRLEVQQAQLDLEAERQKLDKVRKPASAVDIAEARATVREAEAALSTVRNNASQEKNTAKTNLDKAVLDLQAVQKDYSEAVAKLEKARGKDTEKDLRDEVASLERAMRDAEATIAQAQINYDTARNNEVAAVQDAEAKLDLAKAQLDALLAGPDPFDIADQERAVRRAELALAKARQSAMPDPSLVRAVESSRIAIEEIQAQVDQRRLYAPISGEVAAVNITAGRAVQGGQPVVTLIDRSSLELVASPGADTTDESTTRLSLGQTVDVTFSRYPNKTFTGTVTQAPGDSLDGASTAYHISIDSQGQELSAGDIGEVRTVLGRKHDTLWLPPVAVRTSRDRSFVVVREGGEDKRVEVITGLAASDKIEIVSGLSEGDQVIVER